MPLRVAVPKSITPVLITIIILVYIRVKIQESSQQASRTQTLLCVIAGPYIVLLYKRWESYV